MWDRREFERYARENGRRVTAAGTIDISGYRSAQDMYRSRDLNAELNPRNVMRECCDSAEHPNTVPVILALDVTGSMGGAAMEVAKCLNTVITEMFQKADGDVEFMIMGIGDLAYDRAPIQISQFESDIRIAEQLDKIWFEGGGGGNMYESYTAAWYMGARHTRLDCWKRGQKGIIITLGDETINPYLPCNALQGVTGDTLQGDIDTKDLFEEVKDKYELYHIFVDHRNFGAYEEVAKREFETYLGQHFMIAKIDEITKTVEEIIQQEVNLQKNAAQKSSFFEMEYEYPKAEMKETEADASGIGW